MPGWCKNLNHVLLEIITRRLFAARLLINLNIGVNRKVLCLSLIFLPGCDDPLKVAEKGKFVNQDLVDKGYAEIY